MNSTANIGTRLLYRVKRWEAINFSSARREHDRALADPRVAQEHAIQIGRALDRGEPGCTFCR